MSKLIYSINITIDGCCDHTKGHADETVHEYFTDLLRSADTLIYGRKTYELMVPFWPDMARNHTGPDNSVNAFAQAFAGMKRIIVFSRTLDPVADEKTTIIRSGLRETIVKLKQEAGGDMLLGGVELPAQLVELDLIDEYRFVVQPYIAGTGRRLWDNIPLPEQLSLQLVETKVLASGCIALHYIRPKN